MKCSIRCKISELQRLNALIDNMCLGDVEKVEKIIETKTYELIDFDFEEHNNHYNQVSIDIRNNFSNKVSELIELGNKRLEIKI